MSIAQDPLPRQGSPRTQHRDDGTASRTYDLNHAFVNLALLYQGWRAPEKTVNPTVNPFVERKTLIPFDSPKFVLGPG